MLLAARITDDKQIIWLSPRQRDGVLGKFAGGLVKISVSKPQRSRTTPQNAYYRGVVVETVARETYHDDRDAIHEALLDLFAPKVEVLGRVVPKRTSAMSMEELSDYIERIKVAAVSGEWGEAFEIPEAT